MPTTKIQGACQIRLSNQNPRHPLGSLHNVADLAHLKSCSQGVTKVYSFVFRPRSSQEQTASSYTPFASRYPYDGPNCECVDQRSFAFRFRCIPACLFSGSLPECF